MLKSTFINVDIVLYGVVRNAPIFCSLRRLLTAHFVAGSSLAASPMARSLFAPGPQQAVRKRKKQM